MKTTSKKGSYPFILVHGFVGWGENDGVDKILPYFGFKNSRRVTTFFKNDFGCECYAPSLGPFSGAWDRCCELYAALFGGRVDYGEAHSKKYNHNRYGRYYAEPLLKDWDTLDDKGRHKKINLIGHSFGGPTVRLFVNLLTNGSPEEKAVTSKDELFGLFTGGKASWIHTVTTLAGVNNGSCFASWLQFNGKKEQNLVKLICNIIIRLGFVIGETPLMGAYDFHLDQFNITKPYEKGNRIKIRVTKEKRQGLKAYTSNTIDNVGHEMGVHYCRQMNETQNTIDSIYYFAYAGDTTKEDKKTGNRVATKLTTPLMRPFASLIGRYVNPNDGVDNKWWMNDGLVSVVGAYGPENEKNEFFVDAKKIKPGIWYNMPIETMHHLSFVGLKQKKKDVKKFYRNIYGRANDLKPLY